MRILERFDAARKAHRLSLRISRALIEKRWRAEVPVVVNLDHAEATQRRMHRKDPVMSDAIDRVSLYTSADKLSLMARRQRYADFVVAGKPGTARIDDGPATGNLAEKRIKG